MREFGFDSTASDVLAGMDLTGRTALVTGASGGLGAETARALAEKGARVILTARDLVKGRAVAEEIRAGARSGLVDVMELELTVPASVQRFAETFLTRVRALHIMINNAGVMACPLQRTPEGWEWQFATNHLGHFLLTTLLLPALRAGAPARVVSVSSAGHRLSPVVFEDIHYGRRPYDKWQAYGQSKTANALFAVELDRRLTADRVRAFAVHPGSIVTELGRHLSPEDVQELMRRSPGGQGFKWKEVPAGAATSVWAATAPELDGCGGIYLEDCGVARPRTAPDQMGGVEDYAVDPPSAARLWELSERMLARGGGRP